MHIVTHEAEMESSSPATERGPDLLDHYLADIRHIPVLDADAEIALSRRIRGGEARLREVVLQMPWTARRLLEQWREIRSAGRVTATLRAARRAEGQQDPSAVIDRAFRRIEKELERRDGAPTGRRGRETRQRADAAIAAALRRVEPRTELLFDVYVELRKRAAAARGLARKASRSRGKRREALEAELGELEAELGVERAVLEERLETARAALVDLAEARDTFVRHNLRLVVKVAKDFRRMGVSFLDLIQEGNTGLVRAVEKFDYNQGCRFSTYGVWWIRQSCIRAIQNTSRTVRLPTNVHDQLLRYRRLRQEQGPDSEAGSDLSREEVESLKTLDLRPLSLDEPLAGRDEVRLADRLEDPDVPDPGAALDQVKVAAEVPQLLTALDSRERHVLEQRFGMGGCEPQTLQEIGDSLGLSRERVRQIERGALERLRHEASQRGLSELARSDRFAA